MDITLFECFREGSAAASDPCTRIGRWTSVCYESKREPAVPSWRRQQACGAAFKRCRIPAFKRSGAERSGKVTAVG